ATPRRAAVNSLGVGGTNAHLIVEEPPSAGSSGPARAWQALLLSARTPAALETVTDNLAVYLRANPDVSVADVGYTLAVGRHAFEHRRALIWQDAGDVREILERRNP